MFKPSAGAGFFSDGKDSRNVSGGSEQNIIAAAIYVQR
jgi:hypothetical protein